MWIKRIVVKCRRRSPASARHRRRNQQLSVAIARLLLRTRVIRVGCIFSQELSTENIDLPGLGSADEALHPMTFAIVRISLPLIVCPRLRHPILSVVGTRALARVIVVVE